MHTNIFVYNHISYYVCIRKQKELFFLFFLKKNKTPGKKINKKINLSFFQSNCVSKII